MIVEHESFTIELETLDTVLISTIAPKCFACLELFTVQDHICVKVQVSGQTPLRFHDGYCMQHFTFGLYQFLEHRSEMTPQGLLQ